MSDYVSNEMQVDFDCSFLENVDWAADAESFKNDPLPQISQADWDELQGMFDQDPYWAPGSRFCQPDGSGLAMPISALEPQATTQLGFQQHGPPIEYRCEEVGCKRGSKPFKRLPDLRRHQRIHTGQPRYSCLAVHCNRTGQKGFTRKDKCIDHMLDGHDDDTPFRCDMCEPGPLPRQVISVHGTIHDAFHGAFRGYSMLPTLNEYRKCPIPRCTFRIFIGKNESTLDALQDHLRSSDHPRKSLLTFQQLLLDRGYDALTGDIVCPVCRATTFSNHADFYHHFAEVHLHMPVAETSYPPYERELYFRQKYFIGFKDVSDKVREHRPTVLSLWPLFCGHPVWNDLNSRKSGY